MISITRTSATEYELSDMTTVYVDNDSTGVGIVAPLSRGQSSRLQDELVMIHIR